MTIKKITADTLREWGACTDGFRRFCELFPEGADLNTAAERLAEDGHEDWSIWLFNNARTDDEYKNPAEKGFRNTGYWNTGYWNTGHSNTGHSNTGHSNTGDRNTGYFNTITPDDVLVFNKPLSRAAWERADVPAFMYNLPLTYWVSENEMTDAEKEADPNFYMRGGQLRSRSYQDAWALAWKNASERDRKRVQALPNFDVAVFKDITGIDVRAS